jgi:lysyl-tRNA synthetase class 1
MADDNQKKDGHDPYFSHWADQAARRTLQAVGLGLGLGVGVDAGVEAGEGEGQLTVAAGITPSGVIHVGNFREIITVDLVSRALRDQGVAVRFIYSWDDFDVFRKVPAGIPEHEMLKQNLRRSVVDVPDPFGDHDSYASHFIAQLEESIAPLGIRPDFIRQSGRYRSGQYAAGIRRALERKETIRALLDEHRKEPLADDWLPLAGFCNECGRDELDFSWPGDWVVEVHCRSCGHEAAVDLREGGNIKLPWRIDWPMRWSVEGVRFEPGGKEHSSAGGSFDTAKKIVAAVYDVEPPVYLGYDFVRIKGRGGKISSSKGNVVTVADCLEIYEPEMLRWIFASQRTNSEFQISFDLDVIKLYEDYDRARRLAHQAEDGSKADKKRQIARRTLELSSVEGQRIEPGSDAPFVPPFRGLSVVLQAFEGDVERTLAGYRENGEVTTDEEAELLRRRAGCCWRWIELHAPDDFRYRVRREAAKRALSEDERTVLGRLIAVLRDDPGISELDLVPHMKTICEGTELTLKTFSPLAYHLLIDREQGPKITTLITTLGGERALSLLEPSYGEGD